MYQWQNIFKKSGAVFIKPHFDISKFINLLKEINAENILDLGCGTGRHMVVLTKAGFKAYGIDIAKDGVRQTGKWLKQKKLKANLKVGDIYQKLPYKKNFFDGIISIKVLHHAKVSKIKKLIEEIERVMKPGGILMIEVPTKKHAHEKHQEIEPGTFISLGGPEKGLPHHIFNKKRLNEFFHNFEILKIFGSKIEGGIHTPHYTMFAKFK